MEVSLAPRAAPQYQNDVVTHQSTPTVDKETSRPTAKNHDDTVSDPRSKIDKAPLLGLSEIEKPALTEEQTLKPYGVIMLPIREDDDATTRKL
ncbi:MAG: hypothetical protein ABJO29_13145 [Yoonia sp.]|uniref:hypothetical protein n=1 Tax=Yoonia sp. TaxID=2212373 RepID=UPI003265A506